MALTNGELQKMLKGHTDERPRKVADRDGLMALWRASGKVSFVYRYRYNGKQAEVKLGEYTGNDAGLRLADARRKAEKCRAWLNEGHNPAIMLRVIKDERLKPVTVQDALEYWIENYGKVNRQTIARDVSQLKKWIFPTVGDLPISNCDTRQWLQAFEPYSKSAPVCAGMTFQLCKQALKFCRVRRYASSNALDDLSLTDIGKTSSRRDRVLSMSELRDINNWTMQPATSPYYSHLTRLILAFGCRTKELRVSLVREWDLDTQVWTVPKEHSKSGAKISRPIPDAVLPLIRYLIDMVDGKPDRPLLGEIKQQPTVSKYPGRIREILGHKENWTFHDLRRSVATHLNENGIPPHVVEVILGHALPGVMAHYVHTSRLSEQKAALELWQCMLSGEAGDNVVTLARPLKSGNS